MKKLITILLLLLSLLSLTVTAPADLGNFNSYDSDSGGDYDYGGYDYGGSYGGGYSSGGSHSSYGSHGSYTSVSTDDSDASIAIIIVFLCLIFALMRAKYKAYKNSMTPPPDSPVYHTSSSPSNSASVSAIQNNTTEITSAIRKYDSDFSSEKFIIWVKEVFITLQNAWSERSFDKVRNFEKEELFNQHKKQLDEYISKGWINEISRININQAYLFKYVRDNDYEYLSVFLDTRMGDYIKDEKTGEIIKGDPARDYYLKYIYTFMRKTGVLTDPARSNISVTNCPNCGAPTTVTSSGQCEYCGSVITTGEFDWVLSDITGVNERTNTDNGGVEIR